MEVQKNGETGGSLQISTEVIAKIAKLAAMEVDGVQDVSAVAPSMRSILGQKASHESGLCSDGRRCGSDHRQSAGGLWQPHPFHVRQGTGKCEEHGSEYDRYYSLSRECCGTRGRCAPGR